MDIFPLILCGGQGSRLWPISRENMPKQLMYFFDGQSLIQRTLDRVRDIPHFAEPYILTSDKQGFLVEEQLEQIGIKKANIILEPAPKDTAAAITIAAFDIMKHSKDAALLVLSSDSEIQNPQEFRQTLSSTAAFLDKHNKFILFGAEATYPETGYGYVKCGASIASGVDGRDLYKIDKFIEKPSAVEARALIKDGYQWNSGMCLLPLKLFMREMQIYAPEIYYPCEDAMKNSTSTVAKKSGYRFVSLNANEFQQVKSESIDRALFEKTENAASVKTYIGWADIGSWKSIYDISNKDSDGNVLKAENLVAINNKNTFIFSRSSNRVIAAIDLENISIIDTDDATLILSTDHAQDVKKVVQSLQLGDDRKYLKTLTHHFRWGSYDLKLFDKNVVIKKILLKPSKTYHNSGSAHSKHFFLVTGSVEIKYGAFIKRFKRGQDIVIPPHVHYRIRNTSKNNGAEFIKIEF